LQTFKPRIVVNFETYLYLDSKGLAVNASREIRGHPGVGDFKVTMTHAFHSNSIDEKGQRLYAGEPAGFIVNLPGGVTLYHAGDTAVFGDMKLIAEIYKPKLAFLPIGDVFTMGPREAAFAIRLLGVKHVIPMHYATFPTADRQRRKDCAPKRRTSRAWKSTPSSRGKP